MDTLIAEDLLLLLLDDETGRTGWSDNSATVLPGAVLAELALAGVVEVEDRGVLHRDHVRPVEGADLSTVTDPLLARALDLLMHKERSPQQLLRDIGDGLADELAERLAERGVLRREETKVLGLFPRTTWPSVDGSHEDAVRRELAAILVDDQEPTPRAGVIIALLRAAKVLHRTLELPGRSRWNVNKRAEEVADGGWAPDAVKKAVAAAAAAATASISAGSTAST